jgi:hypothetical protein
MTLTPKPLLSVIPVILLALKNLWETCTGLTLP